MMRHEIHESDAAVFRRNGYEVIREVRWYAERKTNPGAIRKLPITKRRIMHGQTVGLTGKIAKFSAPSGVTARIFCACKDLIEENKKHNHPQMTRSQLLAKVQQRTGINRDSAGPIISNLVHMKELLSYHKPSS